MVNNRITNVFIEDGLEDLIKQSIPRIQVDRIPAMCTGYTGTLVVSMNDEEVADIIVKAAQMKDKVGSINADEKFARIVGTTIVIEVVAILKRL